MKKEYFNILDYDASTGLFRWKKRVNSKVSAGSIAGTVDKSGHIVITINKKKHFAHRLAWYFHYKEMPPSQIDHKNQIPNDNRIDNLRPADHKINGRNTKMPSTNTSGHVGVHWFKRTKKWRAGINVLKKFKCLGYFDKKQDAINARLKANKLYGFTEIHGKKKETT